MAIYHDRFIDLQKELRQILLSEQVREMPFDHWGDLVTLFTSVAFPISLPKPCAPAELFPARIPHPPPPLRLLPPLHIRQHNLPPSRPVFPGLPEIPTPLLSTLPVFPSRNALNANPYLSACELQVSQHPPHRERMAFADGRVKATDFPRPSVASLSKDGIKTLTDAARSLTPKAEPYGPTARSSPRPKPKPPQRTAGCHGHPTEFPAVGDYTEGHRGDGAHPSGRPEAARRSQLSAPRGAGRLLATGTGEEGAARGRAAAAGPPGALLHGAVQTRRRRRSGSSHLRQPAAYGAAPQGAAIFPARGGAAPSPKQTGNYLGKSGEMGRGWGGVGEVRRGRGISCDVCFARRCPRSSRPRTAPCRRCSRARPCATCCGTARSCPCTPAAARQVSVERGAELRLAAEAAPTRPGAGGGGGGGLGGVGGSARGARRGGARRRVPAAVC